jgi:hypothetical protein
MSFFNFVGGYTFQKGNPADTNQNAVTDATLTLNPDYKWTGVPHRCSGNTFSSRSEDFIGGLSSSLPPATASSHVVTYRRD